MILGFEKIYWFYLQKYTNVRTTCWQSPVSALENTRRVISGMNSFSCFDEVSVYECVLIESIDVTRRRYPPLPPYPWSDV